MFHTPLFQTITYILGIYSLGWLILRILFRPLQKKMPAGIQLALAWALGNALVSTKLFFLAYTNNLYDSYFIATPYIMTFVVVCTLVWFVYRASVRPMHVLSQVVPIVVILLFFNHLIQHSFTAYLIDWDAVAIWFLKAKVLFLSHGFFDTHYFVDNGLYDFSNKAYPVGIPLVLTGLFKSLRFFNDQIVQLYFLQYFLLIPIVIYDLLKEKTRFSPLSNLMISIGLSITPMFLNFAHSGYVDLPLSFFFLCMTILYIRYLEEKNISAKVAYFALFLCVGIFSIQIKNEGLTFMLAYAVVMCIDLFKNRKSFTRVSPLVLLRFLPAVCIFITVVLWKHFVAIQQIPFYLNGALPEAGTLARIKTSLYYYISVFLDTEIHSLTTIPILLLLAYQIPRMFKKRTYLVYVPLLVVFFQIAVYTYVYVITPMPFDIQLHTSFPRLLLHILPSLYAIAIYQHGVVMEVESKE